MNIREAARQIEITVRAYLSRDERGLSRIPFKMQRPIIMMGPPGVGKTAVVEQVAEKLGVNFVSYSITHHTRQSALGLPFISEEEFGGRDFNISEYTMSEIVASVYRAQKASGVKAGILFLDEVNCVSETLAPAMLQFLQYKTFGMHKLPEGWAIVTAGNPPEYNRAAREFDAAMLDRLIRIDVEPNAEVWQEYAAAHGVHPAVTTYLQAKPANFYKVQAGAQGAEIVTPRGWEDLSRMLQACEAEELPVDMQMFGRYLQDYSVSEDFALYYELFRKYQDDYKIPQILAGNADEKLVERAAAASFDERVAVVGMLLDSVLGKSRRAAELEAGLTLSRADLVVLHDDLNGSEQPAEVLSQRMADIADGGAPVGMQVPVGLGDAAKAERLRVLEAVRHGVAMGVGQGLEAFEAAKETFNLECAAQEAQCGAAMASLSNAFAFLDKAFGEESQENLIFVTKLSADPQLIHLVSAMGNEAFAAHSEALLFSQRGLELLAEVDALEPQEPVPCGGSCGESPRNEGCGCDHDHSHDHECGCGHDHGDDHECCGACH